MILESSASSELLFLLNILEMGNLTLPLIKKGFLVELSPAKHRLK